MSGPLTAALHSVTAPPPNALRGRHVTMATVKWRHLWTAAAPFVKRLLVATHRLHDVGCYFSLNVHHIDVGIEAATFYWFLFWSCDTYCTLACFIILILSVRPHISSQELLNEFKINLVIYFTSVYT
jgi:hypothetical protein